MQTFLPFKSFYESASVLDNRRLNKQIVEAYQIYTDRVPTLNHPACLMWRDHKECLYVFIKACCKEYLDRFNNHHAVEINLGYSSLSNVSVPSWYGNKLFHYSHMVNLLRKDEQHYSKFFYDFRPIGNEPQGYYWPVVKRGGKAWKDFLNWAEWAKKRGMYEVYGK